MKLLDIEKMYNIKFTSKWNRIYLSGAMEWMEVGHEIFNANKMNYINNPKAFLMLDCDCEPLFFEDIPERTADLNEWIADRTNDEKLVFNNTIKLIPFAQTGGGDLYCFLYQDNGEEPQVVLYLHDVYEDPEIIGDTFDEFLLMILLDAAANDEDLDGEQWKAHVGYLSEKYRNEIMGKSVDELIDMYESISYKKANIWI